MILALYILLAIIAVGAVLKITDRPHKAFDTSDNESGDAAPDSQQCCGLHMVCERDSLIASVSSEIEYFEDEELDTFAGRASDEYSPDEADMFRDVLLTLKPDEVAPWGRSIQLRGIQLPDDIRDEFLMLVSENRNA